MLAVVGLTGPMLKVKRLEVALGTSTVCICREICLFVCLYDLGFFLRLCVEFMLVNI